MNELIAIFGPTGVGKTQIAVELARALRERGEDPVALSADAIQVYEGFDVLSGKPSAEQLDSLEHRLLSFVPLQEEFSAGRYAELAHAEIDELLDEGRRPMVVGGTGLYLRAALTELDLRPPVDSELRRSIEEQMDAAGPEQLHGRLSTLAAQRIHPNDRKRIVRALELESAGQRPHRSSEQLWSEHLRKPTRLFGIVMERERLAERISARIDEMLEDGALSEVDFAIEYGVSRTAAKALGLRELAAHLSGDVELSEAAGETRRRHLAYAKRQMTWMRKLPNVELLDRTELDDRDVAERILASLT